MAKAASAEARPFPLAERGPRGQPSRHCRQHGECPPRHSSDPAIVGIDGRCPFETLLEGLLKHRHQTFLGTFQRPRPSVRPYPAPC
jgi:hypothetical protein